MTKEKLQEVLGIIDDMRERTEGNPLDTMKSLLFTNINLRHLTDDLNSKERDKALEYLDEKFRLGYL